MRAPALALHRRERFVLPVILALVAAAWVELWWLDGTPVLHAVHGGEHAAAVHRDAHGASTEPGTYGIGRIAAFISAWLLMTIAMMIPSTLPLVDVFRRLTRRRTDQALLVLLLLGGYLAAWLGYGILVQVALPFMSPLVHALQVNEREGLVAGALLLIAGAFQFSLFKDRCLIACRTPLGFLVRRWNSARSRRCSFRVGFEHGLFCVGCCWALMLLMWVTSVASLFWMLILAVVMTIEKSFRWGRKLVGPVGIALLGAGAFVLATSW